MTNRLRSLWSAGQTAFGVWIVTSSPAGVEMLATMGFDYVGIDCQHGLLDYGDMRDMLLTLRGFELTPVVRVPFGEASAIGRALDAGAEGIIVPMVNSRADAELAVAACRFPPDGVRSFGPGRAHQPFGRDPASINSEVVCLAMIETRFGLEAADDICSTPGLDGIYIGPSDLALSLGFPPTAAEHPPEHAEAVGRILKACETNGVTPAIHAYNGQNARMRADQGFKMVTVTADAGLLAAGARNELGIARGTT
jgi:4-hydroxy-2-oxoheptanedioate aldolase